MINRSELIQEPEAFNVDLGKNPTSRLALYERWGLIPTSIKVGGTGQGIGRKAYYPAIVLQMIKEIQALQKGKNLENIRIEFDEKYSTVYELYDALGLMQLRFHNAEILAYYLRKSGLKRQVQSTLLELLDKSSDHKDLKLGILNLVAEQMRKTDEK